MTTNRRSAIKYFIILTAGIAFLPSCKSSSKKITAFNNIPVDEDQQALLAELSGTIIPATDTPGAKEVSAHIFTLQMLNDCYKQADRDKFMKGMQQFGNDVQKKYNKSFVECSIPEREVIIAAANTQKDNNTDAAYFYKTAKQLTVRAYTGSQYYLSNVQVYKQIPGKYISSVAV